MDAPKIPGYEILEALSRAVRQEDSPVMPAKLHDFRVQFLTSPHD